jgi:hypothetical protein
MTSVEAPSPQTLAVITHCSRSSEISGLILAADLKRR